MSTSRAPFSVIAASGLMPALLRAGRALRHRDFRLFFAGQGLSLIGTWMQQVAMSWLVYRLTGSAFVLGIVAFASQLPNLLLAPIAGVLADRWNRHHIVVATQALSMLQAGLLAALVLTEAVQVWHLITLATFLGIVNGFDVPARQSLLVQLVRGPGDLPNAIALNASMFNGARLVGPAIAGVLIAAAGEGVVFLVNTVSYVAVLIALLRMDVAQRVWPIERPAIVRHLREGVRYALGSGPIRMALALLALVSLLGMPYVVLLPVFASDVLGGGPRMLGFLMAAAGLGALAGALYLAARTSVRGLGRVIAFCTALFGASLAAFALSRAAWLSIAVLLFAGFGIMVFTAAINTILQTIVDEDKRGRVVSLYVMAFMGVTPFGSLLAGTLASRIGAPNTVLLGGGACLLLAAWFYRRLPALREQIRPIYIRLGIIPEVATGLETAIDLRPQT